MDNGITKEAFQFACNQRLECLKAAFGMIKVFAIPSLSPEYCEWLYKIENDLLLNYGKEESNDKIVPERTTHPSIIMKRI